MTLYIIIEPIMSVSVSLSLYGLFTLSDTDTDNLSDTDTFGYNTHFVSGLGGNVRVRA